MDHEPYAITNRWQVNDTYLDWYGREEFQTYQRRGPTYNDLGLAQGTPLDWTTNSTAGGHAVVRDGFGFLKENMDAGLGDHYWMLDVDMDCETAVNIGGTSWFEVKSFMSNAPNGWEPDVTQADRPYVSGNHFAKCGKINIFQRGSGAVSYRDFDAADQCSFPGVERRCSGSAVAGVRVGRRHQGLAKRRGLRPVEAALSALDGRLLYADERQRIEPKLPVSRRSEPSVAGATERAGPGHLEATAPRRPTSSRSISICAGATRSTFIVFGSPRLRVDIVPAWTTSAECPAI